MALPVVGVDLDRMAHQLGRGVVLVRSNGKARHDLGLAGLPRPYYSGSHSAYALDRAGVGRETALAFWQRRYVRACGVDLGGYVVHVKARMEEGFLTTELGAVVYGPDRRRVPMLVPFLPHR